MGLHTGEVISEEGDYFGKNVILAARIAAQALGGEILVSEELRQAVSGGNGNGMRFDDGRELELKGLAGSHRVYRADWAESGRGLLGFPCLSDGSLEPLTPAHHQGGRAGARRRVHRRPRLGLGRAAPSCSRAGATSTGSASARFGSASAGAAHPGASREGGEPVARAHRLRPRELAATGAADARTCSRPARLVAGPAVLLRSIRAELIFEKRHPEYDHFLVWMFAVSAGPPARRARPAADVRGARPGR